MLQGRTRKDGITLIALIVTIVILLILSTVTIMEVRETALFEKSRTAARDYKVAQIDEQNKMDKWANDVDIWANMDNSSEGGSTKPDTKPEEKPKDPEQEKPKPRTEVTNDLQIGDYVKYNVTYTDAIKKKTNFTEENGWRVIDPGHKYSDKTYDGVKIIPTGVPVIMYYHYEKIMNSDSYAWKPTAKEVADFKKTCGYVAIDNKQAGVTAAAGLKNHIGEVKILAAKPKNDVEYVTGKGWREMITNNNNEVKGEQDLATAVMIPGVATGIECPDLEWIKTTMMKRKNKGGREFIINRSTDEDVIGSEKNTFKREDDAALGFWNLQDLGIGEYQQKSGGWYWIASPHSASGNGLRCMGWSGSGVNGYFDWNYNTENGLRPIVSLKSNIVLEKSTFQGN